MKTQLSKPARSKAIYTDQYKQEALELWRASGRSAAKVSPELGIRPHCSHHLCARGNARQAIFPDERAPRFEAAVLCFVLMGNHFHLVPHTHWGKSAALDGIRCWFATRFILIAAIVRSGHLFQGESSSKAHFVNYSASGSSRNRFTAESASHSRAFW